MHVHILSEEYVTSCERRDHLGFVCSMYVGLCMYHVMYCMCMSLWL